MGEDAAAGRPFLAALVVGRARGGLPARGFYDRAAALGRGPEPGETEAAFYDRESPRRGRGSPVGRQTPRRAGRGADGSGGGSVAGVHDRIGFVDRRDVPVHVPASRAGRKLVVTPDGATWAPRPRVDNAMVKALARAFRWRKDAG